VKAPLGSFVKVSFNVGGETKRIWWKPWKRVAVWVPVETGVIRSVTLDLTLNGPSTMTLTATGALASLFDEMKGDQE
jgi:hypothetical protein